jgi:acetyl esterase/lipase
MHPQAAALMERAARSARPNAHLLPVDEARRYFDEESAAAETGQAVQSVADVMIPVRGDEIRARAYRPTGGRLPVIVYLHGGGWVLGSILSHDATCRALANAACAVIVSVEYRRGPEHRFPIAVEDAFAACAWIADHGSDLGIDSERIAVAGDSAGANLAIAVTLLARERNYPEIAFQLLAYPVTTTDLDNGFDSDYDGVVLQRDELYWHQQNYFACAADARSPLASPLDQADLGGLPPAMVISAGCDPIHGQGERYAEALRRAGVSVEHVHYPGMVHGFIQLPATLDAAAEAIARAGAALNARLGRAQL